MSGFAFPLGVYPVDPIEPKSGYTTAFEPADDGSEAGGGGGGGESDDGPEGLRGLGGLGGGGGEWEEWPDRYVFDILVSAARVEPLCRTLLSLLPGRVYPILDFLGQDEWREVDPYVSYDLLGMDRLMDTIRRFRGFFYEDGLVGFGAMSEEPFLYVFVDEHKVVTVRAEAGLKEKVEKVLAAFDLELLDELASADSVTHEHRSVLEAPSERPDLFVGDEIVELLRDEWRLVLNIDPESNIDEDGKELGMTGWRCILRYDPPLPVEDESKSEESEEKQDDEDDPTPAKPTTETSPTTGDAANDKLPVSRYAEIYLTAESLHQATNLALEALEKLLDEAGVTIDPDTTPEPMMVASDRWNADDFAKMVEQSTNQKPEMTDSSIHHAAWLN